MHRTELMLLEPNASGIEISVRKLINYKSPGIDKIPTEMMQSAGSRVLFDIHTLIGGKN